MALQPLTSNRLTILLPFTVTMTGATLTTVQIGYSQVGSLARLVSLNEIFLQVKFLKFSLVPTVLSAAQFAEAAAVPRHLPYNPDSADGVPPAPLSLASLATLPGYRRWNQGNGAVVPLSIKLRASQMRLDRFMTDQPSLLDLCYYASVLTICNCMITCRVSGLKYDQ